MTKGPRRLVLDQYLDSATEGVIKNAGRDWARKADDLQELGEALKQAAAQAELRIGEQTLTGPALRAAMEESSGSMLTKSTQLRAAGEALRQVGQQIADTRDARDSLADLGPKPSPYQAPPGTPGVEKTPEEIQAQADASQARQNERSAWQSQYDKQEAKSLALTKELDAAFLGAIPPMKEIHGQQDPTEPPPDVPSGPDGPYLPGTQAPPVTGGGGNGGGKDNNAVLTEWNGNNGNENGNENGNNNNNTNNTTNTTTTTTTTTPTTTTTTTTPTTTTPVHTEHPSTTVTGTSQNGVTYQPTGAQVSAPAASGGAGGASGATSAAAFGAAGGAGGLAAGAVRPGAVPTSPARGASPVRPIGSTGRAASAGSLSRAAGSSPASRSAGSAPARGASAGSTSGRGSAGGRAGASGARGSSTGSGSRSGSRGTSGARAGGQGAGGRGGRKGERETAEERDSLVYDQDWLGDDDVAPGVLD